jgi:hypothetical protein
MEISLRTHEVGQLEEMLPILRDVYDQQYYEEGVEDVESMLDGLDAESKRLVMDVELFKELLIGITTSDVREEQGGVSNTSLRPDWLAKKIALRLDEKDAFEQLADESDDDEDDKMFATDYV